MGRQMRSVTIAAMMLVAVPTIAGAEVSYVSSPAWLLERCEKPGSSGWGEVFCTAYTNGVTDDLRLFPKIICVPGDVSAGQITRVVIKYLQVHPEQLHHHAANITFDALKAAFPCK